MDDTTSNHYKNLEKYGVTNVDDAVSWDEYDDLLDRLKPVSRGSTVKAHMINSKYENTSFGVSAVLLNEALGKLDARG